MAIAPKGLRTEASCNQLLLILLCNVVEAHGYGFRSTVVSGELSRSKTSAIIAIIALGLLRECSPLTTVDLLCMYMLNINFPLHSFLSMYGDYQKHQDFNAEHMQFTAK